MLTWLVLGIAVYFVYVFASATARFLKLGVGNYLSSRADEPDLEGVALRLDRAAVNMQENFLPFAALAVAALALPNTNMDLAILGAQAFVISRLFYIVLYALALPPLRSLMAVVGWVGMGMMAYALFAAAPAIG